MSYFATPPVSSMWSRRSSERALASTPSGDADAPGSWLSSLTFAFTSRIKAPQAVVVVCLLLSGCASNAPTRSNALSYERLNRALDDFCRAPQMGTFERPANPGRVWNLVVADHEGVYLATTHGSRQPHIGPRFRDRLNSDDLAGLQPGATESEVVSQFGKPSRTWYDLYPILDSVIPITRIFGRDNKRCDYHLFTTDAHSQILQASLQLSYTKGSDSIWRVAWVTWTMESTREPVGESGDSGNGIQPSRPGSL